MDPNLFDDIDNLDGDDGIAIQLGNMVVVWAAAETAQSMTLAVVSGMNYQMAMTSYYRIPTFEARNKFIRSLVENWLSPPTKYDASAIHKTLEKINSLASSRNHWIHGIWSRNQATKAPVVFQLRAPEGERLKPVKAADIKNHNDAVRERTKQLHSLTYTLRP